MRTVWCGALVLWIAATAVRAEDGYELWLRYREVPATAVRAQYRQAITGIYVEGVTPTLDAARRELVRGVSGLLGQEVRAVAAVDGPGVLVAGTPESSATIKRLGWEAVLRPLGGEGYLLRTTRINSQPCIVIAANRELGVLYGTFHFLRLLQTQQDIGQLDIATAPRIQRRLLNHWDLTNGSIERGYAGKSLWNWKELPVTIDLRLIDYARANASLGINGTVLNNVNSEARVLTAEYLRKVAALADTFRPYGVRVYLSPRFSAPIELGKLGTADPLDAGVVAWWQAKIEEIYKLIPDFGGFLVKANSEGQPGPQDYGRTHADGANMLAKLLAPHDGIVMWRAFVYGKDKSLDPDRVKQAYQTLVPLDGQFEPNVMLQVKNGPLDFQPREPVHPIFGAMPKTPLALELQITQEYLGHSNFLVYLAPMWQECLQFDTHARGPGSTVARIVSGRLDGHQLSAIAGVANTGTDRNWCGHHFAQANWYAFGRLAWDPELDAKTIAEEWTRMTFASDPPTVATIVTMMMGSWETLVDTMMPLGLNVLSGARHYPPSPKTRGAFHRADQAGLGYDRTRRGSGAVDQYHAPQCDRFDDLAQCPEKYLLWFHHVPWDHRLKSGRTLWEELCRRYTDGAARTAALRRTWAGLEGKIDAQRFREVAERLAIQERDAATWRDTCLKYFHTLSGRPIVVSEQ